MDKKRTAFVYSLNYALAAVAGVYYYQVLGISLEVMGEHEKWRYLGQMGVDRDAMQHSSYRHEVIEDRLRKLTLDGLEYEAAWKTVQGDDGLRTNSVVEGN